MKKNKDPVLLSRVINEILKYSQCRVMSAVINIGIAVGVAEEVVNSWVFRDE